MAAAPWYLLALGIVLVIVGLVMAIIGGNRSGPTLIDARMSDKEIKRQLEKDKGSLLGNLVMAAGLLVILVSIVWRIVRVFI